MCWEERYTQRRTASSSRIFRRALRARRRRVSFFTLICYALLLLSFFTTDHFVRVTHALALIRLGTTEVADFSSHLAYHLLIDTFDYDIGLARGFSGDALRQFVFDRVREAEGKGQHLTFGLSPVTDTHQLELALKALADADYHVVDQRTGSAGHRTVLLITIASSKAQLVRLLDDFNRRMNIQFQSALGTLHRKLLAGQLDFNASGQLDGVLSNARHAYPPLEHSAEYFATHASGTGSTISHHTFIGGNDRHTQTTAYFRQLVYGFVLAQARTTGALQLFDNRTAFEILQLDGQQRLGIAADLVTRNVTFVLENVGNCHLQLGSRHAYDGLFSHLGITDTS